MGQQKLGMVIPFGINLERQVAQRGFWHSYDPRSHHCGTRLQKKTPAVSWGKYPGDLPFEGNYRGDLLLPHPL
ncbi:MAG: hypothetical protein F6K56_38210 [Moorea sp. SIO3G5]|nr:hypothetical protein [Moorena sp. SIO3G5]